MRRRCRKSPMTFEEEVRRAYGEYADDILRDIEKGMTFDEAAEEYSKRIERLRKEH